MHIDAYKALESSCQKYIETINKITMYQTTNLQKQIQQLESELQIAKERIAAMETSKFWKIRQIWFKFKKTLGLPTTD
jgi:hypothetical protein